MGQERRIWAFINMSAVALRPIFACAAITDETGQSATQPVRSSLTGTLRVRIDLRESWDQYALDPQCRQSPIASQFEERISILFGIGLSCPAKTFFGEFPVFLRRSHSVSPVAKIAISRAISKHRKLAFLVRNRTRPALRERLKSYASSSDHLTDEASVLSFGGTVGVSRRALDALSVEHDDLISAGVDEFLSFETLQRLGDPGPPHA